MSREVLDWWTRALRALKTAESLADEDPDAAASRAYYAAFYAVSALFTAEQRTFRKHTAIETAVHRDLVKPGRWPQELGTAFSWLASIRYTGDYGGESHVGTQEAEEAVRKARRIVQAVRADVAGFLPDEP